MKPTIYITESDWEKNKTTRYTASLVKDSQRICIIIPCYKREKETLEAIRYYSQLDVDIITGTQCYSEEFFSALEEIPFIGEYIDIGRDEPAVIGSLRKELIAQAFQNKAKYKYILMHDNDLYLSEGDIDSLVKFADAYPDCYIFSPDFYNIVPPEKAFVSSRLCFVCTLIRADKLKQIYQQLSDVEANEDSELVYLLENKGMVISMDHFRYNLGSKDYQSETTFDDKISKLERSAKFFKEKYGDDVEIEVRPSGKHITKFTYTPKFPMKLRFNEKPTTEYYNSLETIRISMLNYPTGDFRKRCFEMIKSTWIDEPYDTSKDRCVSNYHEVQQMFKDLLQMKVLPNSMEQLSFTFCIEGMTLIEITHLLRHRTFSSVHAQCSADRFLTHDSVFIPSSIVGTEFEEQYKGLTEKTKQLYQDMIDSGNVSIMDARYILPRNHRYFYYVTANLKDLMAFIQQRKCEQIQPELDNVIAHLIHALVSIIIPEVKELVSLECGPTCYYVKSPKMENSRVYIPNDNHMKYMKDMYKTEDFISKKTRKEMGIAFNSQEGE